MRSKCSSEFYQLCRIGSAEINVVAGCGGGGYLRRLFILVDDSLLFSGRINREELGAVAGSDKQITILRQEAEKDNRGAEYLGDIALFAYSVLAKKDARSAWRNSRHHDCDIAMI